MAIMKAFFIFVTIWINWIAIQNLVSAKAPPPRQRAPPAPPPIRMTSIFNLSRPAKYKEFVTNVRDKLAEKYSKENYALKCSMKKIGKIVPGEGFMYVELIASPSVTITLALNLSNAYVIGYLDKFNNSDRAFFFKDCLEKPTDVARVFPTATGRANRLDLVFKGRYLDLERYDKRTSTDLGISKLKKIILDIYGENRSAKDIEKKQRKFLLMAVQMVSEAARFNYISDEIPENPYEFLKVNESVVALENGWDTLSSAVYESYDPNLAPNMCGLKNNWNPPSPHVNQSKTTTDTECELTKHVSLTLISGKNWTFNMVKEIREVVAILKAESPGRK